MFNSKSGNKGFFSTKVAKATIGYSLAILSAVLGGLSDVLPKPILDESVDGFDFPALDPMVITSVMYLINGVFFTILILSLNKIRSKDNQIVSFKNLGRKNIFYIILISFAEITATTIFYFGLKETSAVNSAILGNSDIIFTTILAVIFFREILKKSEAFPFSLIIVGSILIPLVIDLYKANFVLSYFVFGDMLVVLAGLFYGIEMNLYKHVSERIDSKRIIQIISIVGGFCALGLALSLNVPFNLEFSHLPIILVTGIFGIGISVLFMIMAIKYIGAIRTILIFSTTTIFGIIFSALILGEDIIFLHGIAFVSVFIGVYFLRNRLVEN